MLYEVVRPAALEKGAARGRLRAHRGGQRRQPRAMDFNVALQEESKDRKYRFVVKRLMKANQRQGDEVDEELDMSSTEAGARRQVPLRAEQGAAHADASAASASATGASDSAAQAPPASYSSDVV